MAKVQIYEEDKWDVYTPFKVDRWVDEQVVHGVTTSDHNVEYVTCDKQSQG